MMGFDDVEFATSDYEPCQLKKLNTFEHLIMW